MAKNIGPTFSDEVQAAELGGLPFSWGATVDDIYGRENLTPEQNTTLDGVLEAHNPTKQRLAVIRTPEFIARWTNQEYIKLEQHRASELAAGKIGNAKNWDTVVTEDVIDMHKTKFQNLKADLVEDGILTQARADEIFDTLPEA